MNVVIQKLMEDSGVKFGTSGARGLVTDMTDRVCYCYTQGFIQYLESLGEIEPHTSIAVAGDLRPSTPRIMRAVMTAIADRGYTPIHCGFIPSPAVAFYGIEHHIPAIMVTGSHIPADRNGIKFNKSEGEILKADEAGIRAQVVRVPNEFFDKTGAFVRVFPDDPWPISDDAAREYQARYLSYFDANALRGLRIGVYQHSAVGRDMLAEIVRRLGAEVVLLGRSNTFVPVDTEAIRPEDITLAWRWIAEYKLDAIFSTDGDSDRPLLANEKGEWLRGDVGGILCAKYLGMDVINIPVSCNTAAEKSAWFAKVNRTRIGSPYVIAAMIEAQKQDPSAKVAGYEANGGFLIQTPIEQNGKLLKSLPTRDAFIYLLGVTLLAVRNQQTLSQLTATLPGRYTHSDRIQNFSQAESKAIIEHFSQSLPEAELFAKIENAFGDLAGKPTHVDYTDGVRMTFDSEDVIHLRPSGNAPEFRCYTEAATPEQANKLCFSVMGWLRHRK